MLELLKKLLITPTKSTSLQMFRYLFVGGGAFVVDSMVLYLLTDLAKINYLISAPLAFLFGVAANFLLTKILVFRQNLRNRFFERVIFFLICFVGLLLTEGIMFFCVNICNRHYFVAKVIATAIVFLWNFFAKKLILYRNCTASE